MSKVWLDVAARSGRPVARFANTAAGYAEGVAHLAALPTGERPAVLVVEATGGLERGIDRALTAVGWTVVVVKPRQVRDFARCLGRLAKTDRLDADVLARYGEPLDPEPRPRPDARLQELRDLEARRRHLVEMLTMERNRLQQAPPRTRAGIRRQLEFLREELADVTRQLAEAIPADPTWRETAARLRTVAGIGPIPATLLVLDLPEPGRLDRTALAALVGVAPFNRDRGAARGTRSWTGGRAAVRTGLSMAVRPAIRWNPAIRARYTRLTAAGKRDKGAVVACIRKLLAILNVMLRTKTDRDPQRCQPTTTPA